MHRQPRGKLRSYSPFIIIFNQNSSVFFFIHFCSGFSSRENKNLPPTGEQFSSSINSSSGTTTTRRRRQTTKVTLKARAGGLTRRRSSCLSVDWDKATMRKRRRNQYLRSWKRCPTFPVEVKTWFTPTPSQA